MDYQQISSMDTCSISYYNQLTRLIQSKQWLTLSQLINTTTVTNENQRVGSYNYPPDEMLYSFFKDLVEIIVQLDCNSLLTTSDTDDNNDTITTLAYILDVVEFVTRRPWAMRIHIPILMFGLLQCRYFDVIHTLKKLTDHDDETLTALFMKAYSSTGTQHTTTATTILVSIDDITKCVQRLIETLRIHISYNAISLPNELYRNTRVRPLDVTRHMPDWQSILEDFDPSRELLRAPPDYMPYLSFGIEFQSWYIRRYQPILVEDSPEFWCLNLMNSGARFCNFNAKLNDSRELFQWIVHHYQCDFMRMLEYTKCVFLYMPETILLFLSCLDKKQFKMAFDYFTDRNCHYYFPLEVALEHGIWVPSPRELRRLIRSISTTLQTTEGLHINVFQHPFRSTLDDKMHSNETIKQCFQRCWAKRLYHILWGDDKLSNNDPIKISHARKLLVTPIDDEEGEEEEEEYTSDDIMNDLLVFGNLNLVKLAEKIFDREWPVGAYYVALITSKDTNHVTILNHLTKKGIIMTDTLRERISQFLINKNPRPSSKVYKWFQQFTSDSTQQQQQDTEEDNGTGQISSTVKEKRSPRKKARLF